LIAYFLTTIFPLQENARKEDSNGELINIVHYHFGFCSGKVFTVLSVSGFGSEVEYRPIPNEADNDSAKETKRGEVNTL